MKTRLLTMIIIIIIHLMSLTACAQQKANMVKADGKEQSGNVLYYAPANWQRLDNNGQVIYVAPSSNEGTVITILPGQELYGSLRTWFEDFLVKNGQGKEQLEGGQIRQASSDEGYEVLFSQRVMKERDGSVSYQLYVAANPGNRVEVIALISTTANQFNQYQQVFQQFIKSVDFVNVKGANNNNFDSSKNNNSRSDKNADRVSNNSNVLKGLYVGTISRQQFNPNTKFYDYVVRQQYYLFAPDGRVYFALPKTDIRNLDLACSQDPDNCGQYALRGNQLELFRQGQQPQSFNLEKSGNSFKLGSNRFYPIGSFDGLRLSGAYSFRSFTNLSGAGGVSGGISGERTISFNSNGQFVANNFVGFAASGGVAGAASSTNASGQGRYQITGNTITLSYSNSREEQFVFFVYPENEQEAKPGLIVIGGVSYLLRD